jgi:IS5 family transposase
VTSRALATPLGLDGGLCPSIPVELICSVMVLQALEGLSDRDAVRQLKNRIDWKVACGLALDDPGFDFTNLTYWRARLRASARPERIFDAVRAVVDATGVLAKKHRQALDSTVLDDAVATQDTVTQIISAARRVIASVPAAARAQLSHDYSVPGKPIIDWSLRQERDDLVSALAADATALLDAVAGGELNADQADAVGMLALVSAQDVEPGDQPGHWRIARKVAKDRVISTVDPEARHGHKSVSVRKDGFKAHICIEPGTGIATAAKLTPANHPDGPAGLELMAGEPEGLEVLAGSAYGSGATRTELKTMGHNLVIKPVPSHPAVPGGLGRDEFNVDHHSRRVTCPAGHVARLPLSGVAKFAPHCSSCPLRARCTNAKARTFSVGPNDAELVAARAAWHGPELTASYRQHRPMAERSISWLVAKGNRRLRYRGVERNDAWLHLRAAALNLRRLLALGLAHDGTWVLANS